jgi:hypothetical protein
MSNLKTGDTFIRISKYGHVFGIVKELKVEFVQSVNYACSYARMKVVATTGVVYDLNECHKVIKQYNEEELIKLAELFKKLEQDPRNFGEVKEMFQVRKQMKNL